MKWFFGLSKIFRKKIKLEKTDDLIVFHRLKNSLLKIGSKVEVPTGFNLVAVHYNKVCDVLAEGDYELDGVTLPNLLRFARKQVSKKGEFTPTSIFADLYFVNTSTKNDYTFKTPNFIRTKGGQGKVKIRLEGSFEMQLVNVKRFMQNFCDIYAILKNKKIRRDLSFYVGRLVESTFDKTDFVLSDYLARRGKVVDAIMENIGALEKDLGIKISSVIIERVLVPKRYQSSKGFLQDNSAAGFNSEEVLKMVENRLNNLQEDMSVVFAKGKESQTQTAENFGQFPPQMPSDSAANTDDFSQNNTGSVFQTEKEPFVNYKPESQSEQQNFASTFDQKAPNIIAIPNDMQEKEEKQIEQVDAKEPSLPDSEQIQSQESQQSLTKKEESSLVTCLSCGAKNFEGVQFCCVCKSKL